MKQASVPKAPHGERRARLIQNHPLTLGARWALAACEEAASNGRRIEGGWPGTVPEARMRVLGELTRELAAEGLPPLSHSELVTATAAAYERAKREWLLASKAPRFRVDATEGASDLRSNERKNS